MIQLVLAFCLLLVNAVWAEGQIVSRGGTLNLESNDYSQYFIDKKYQKVAISESYGKQLQFFKVLDYKPDELYKYYLNKICAGIYIANCSHNKENLKLYTGTDVSKESGLIDGSIKSIAGYTLNYTTINNEGKPQLVSGAVLMPDSDKPLKGVVLFYHYTILDKNNIPSNFNGDDFQLSRLMASAIASDGYIVVMPDYIGFGIDQNSVHPYILYPEVNALSGLYMLKPLESALTRIAINTVDNKIPLYISGYSEGGSYALWAAKIVQDNLDYFNQHGFTLKKTVPILGAYNMSRVTWNYVLNSQINDRQAPDYIENSWVTEFAKPGLYVDAVHSYQYYESAALNSPIFTPEFLACNNCVFNGIKYDIPSWIEKAPAKDGYKYALIKNAAKAAGYNKDGSNSVAMLTVPEFKDNPQLHAKLLNADIYNWKAITPISLLMLEYDSIVPRLNSETAYIGLTKNNSRYVKVTRVPNQNFKVRGYIPWTDVDVDHPQGISFMLLFARKEFAEDVNANN